MFVSQSMTRKVITIDKEAGVLEAQDKMARNRIRHLPVVAPEDQLIGIVTDRDIRSALPYGLFVELASDAVKARIAELKIKDIMTPEPKTISPDYTIGRSPDHSAAARRCAAGGRRQWKIERNPVRQGSAACVHQCVGYR